MEKIIRVVQRWLPYPTFIVESGHVITKSKLGVSVTTLKEGEKCKVYSGWMNARTGQSESRKYVIVNEGGDAVQHNPEDFD